MAEIIIDNVKYTNVPNKKAGTKFASALTQSNIGMSQAVQDYVNGSYFYPLVNAIDINWDGIEIGENSYINNTSDLIKWVIEKNGDVDLSSYATITYVNDKITELIGAAPETLDTLGEIAAALQDDASLAYVTEALSGKANAADVYDKTSVDNMFSGLNSTYATTSYVTTELEKKADVEDIPVVPDMSNYVTMTSYNMLVQRVDELAYLINYYHPAQPEQQVEGYWTLNGVRTDFVQISKSDSPITLSFVSNPTIASGIGRWEFLDQQPGIVVDPTTGAMTIDPMYLSDGNWYGVSYYYYDANDNQILSSYINVQVTASSKPYAIGQWLDSNMNIVYDKVVAAGDSTTYTFTFDGTPSTGWSFSYDGGGFAGVDFDTTTGTITIDVGNRTDYVRNRVYLYANYPEDSTYQYTTSVFNTLILATGTNPNFYYEENNINLNNQMGQYTPDLLNTLSSYDHITYVSSDSGVASVEVSGVLYYVADGNCTLTATAYDSSDNVIATATANVTCETLKDWPYCTWSNVMSNGKVAVASGDTTPVTCTFTGTPASGWVIQQSTYAGITCNTSTCDVTIDATNMQVGQYTIECTYPGDATYYSQNMQLIIDIIPAGSNPYFYFENTTVNINSNTGPYSVYPVINLPAYDHLGFISSDTSVATVSNSILNWQSAGTCTITATAYDISNNVLATASYTCICESSTPTPEFTNVNMHYEQSSNTINKGYFDTNPIEGGGDIDIFVEFEGPQYTYNSGDFTITKDTTFDSGEYVDMNGLYYQTVSYNNDINSIKFSLNWSVPSGVSGTNRYVFDFSYNGVSLISDGIKIYNNGESC